MAKTFIIAEAGVNHNAELSLAYKLIDAAILAGADAVKFQAAIPELVTTGYVEKAIYQKASSGAKESQLEMIQKIHFSLENYDLLKKYCDEKEIIFFSTARLAKTFPTKKLTSILNFALDKSFCRDFSLDDAETRVELL